MNKSSKEIQTAYDERYYLQVCGGAEEAALWKSGKLSRRLQDALTVAALKGTEDILDVGCGRGEIVGEAARLGCRAVGIDYSTAAVSLAQERITATPWASRCQFLLGDITQHELEDKTFDVVFALDVFEHLSPDELRGSLRTILPRLKPDGRLIFHTSPNRYYYSVAYRIVRTLSLLLGRGQVPRDARCDYEKEMHINELSCAELRQALLQAGFDFDIKRFGLERVMETIKQARFWRCVQRLLSRLACHPALRNYTNSDFIGMAARRRGVLNKYYRLRPGQVIPLDHPFFFHEGWYTPVLHEPPSHRWAAPHFSLRGWSQTPLRVHLRFVSLARKYPRLSFGGVGCWSKTVKEAQTRLLTADWPATTGPVTLSVAAGRLANIGEDPRCFSACLQEVWCDNG
jgi:2-polyprenyl-3-methyl-5-hydroxy-6-metoxy-1,4-benzoquinol methylase